jgi:hypothetical protein
MSDTPTHGGRNSWSPSRSSQFWQRHHRWARLGRHARASSDSAHSYNFRVRNERKPGSGEGRVHGRDCSGHHFGKSLWQGTRGRWLPCSGRADRCNYCPFDIDLYMVSNCPEANWPRSESQIRDTVENKKRSVKNTGCCESRAQDICLGSIFEVRPSRAGFTGGN